MSSFDLVVCAVLVRWRVHFRLGAVCMFGSVSWFHALIVSHLFLRGRVPSTFVVFTRLVLCCWKSCVVLVVSARCCCNVLCAFVSKSILHCRRVFLFNVAIYFVVGVVVCVAGSVTLEGVTFDRWFRIWSISFLSVTVVVVCAVLWDPEIMPIRRVGWGLLSNKVELLI